MYALIHGLVTRDISVCFIIVLPVLFVCIVHPRLSNRPAAMDRYVFQYRTTRSTPRDIPFTASGPRAS